MMNRVTSKFIPALVALTAILVVGYAQAATITVSYVNGTISTTSNFATGTTTTVDLSQQVNMAAGQFFRFGVNLSVSGNPDPEATSAYGAAANTAYGVTYPANLGFSALGMSVGSTDANGAALAPLVNTTTGKTRVTYNNTPWPGATTDNGDVSGGIAGSPSTMFKGFGPFDPTSTTSVTSLGALATPGANFINTLPYGATAIADGIVTLSPRVDLASTALWSETVAGVDDGSGGISSDASFLARVLGTGDSIVYPSANNGNILVSFGSAPITPEPASLGLIGLGLMGLLARRRVA